MTNNIRKWSPVFVMLGIIAVLALVPDAAHASNGATAMPWDKGPKALADSLTGPLGYSLSLIGLAVGGFGLFFGADIGGFAKFGLSACFAISFIAFAGQILSTIFGFGGVF